MKKEEMIYRNSETSEKALERRFVEKMKSFGLLTVKNQDPMMCGMPDRMVVLPRGKVAWVEFKSAGKYPTELQYKQISRLQEKGHIVFVVDDRDALDMALAFINGCLAV